MIGTDVAEPALSETDREESLPSRADAVAVAYVHSDDVAYSWHHSLVELIGHDLATYGRILAGGYLAMRCGTDGLVEARNEAVRQFLAEDHAGWLWWVDTDMGFAPDTVDRLAEVADPLERPIVGGLCFSQREDAADGMGGWRTTAVPTIYDWTTLPDGRSGYAVRWDFPPHTLLRCHGTGSACVLIHRSVFERIADKFGPVWYQRVPNPSTGQLISEDLSFCVRAGALDIPVHVHTGVATTHQKPVWLSGGHYWRERAVAAPPEPLPPGSRVAPAPAPEVP